jgi:hypothetical protein
MNSNTIIINGQYKKNYIPRRNDKECKNGKAQEEAYCNANNKLGKCGTRIGKNG